MKITPSQSVGLGEPVFVVAEIGKNFIQEPEDKTRTEYLARAKELILAAKEAGADAVKFQTHNYEDEVLPLKFFSPHFAASDRYRWVKKNSQITTPDFWQALKDYCDKLDITFFSAPMSRGAAQLLAKLGVPFWKIGSADILDFVMLDYIAKTGKPIIISSGMSTLEEIDQAINFLQVRADKIILLHCISKYPCPPEDLNLETIDFFQKRYHLPVGFSDHSLGYDSVLAAVARGAVVIEKHFSFRRDLWGPDHKVSMTPDEFKSMVAAIRRGDNADFDYSGQATKSLNPAEAEFRPVFRKSLVMARSAKKGEAIKPEMIYAMRPQLPDPVIKSQDYEQVINKKLNQDLNKYDALTWAALE